MYRKETHEIKKTIEIALHVVTIPVAEVTLKKYAEASGLSEDRVRDYCIYGVLQARKVNARGEQDPKGIWMIEAHQKLKLKTPTTL